MAPPWSLILPTLDPSSRRPRWTFFTAHEKTLLAAEARAGVRHHVALSIVGADRSPDNGYFRAKVFQEELIRGSGIPYTVIRSTQFMEFLGSIADAGQKDGVINIATGLFQPIAADNVAAIVADTALAALATARSKSRDPRGRPSTKSSEVICG
jgi:uncharacterized protein YbjT (DUF2867 family)